MEEDEAFWREREAARLRDESDLNLRKAAALDALGGASPPEAANPARSSATRPRLVDPDPIEAAGDGEMFEHNGEPAILSTVAAEMLGKRPDDLLRAIRNLDLDKALRLRRFAETSYLDRQGRKQPAYLITKDGLLCLVMGMRGAKPREGRERIIARLNEHATMMRAKHAAPQIEAPRVALPPGDGSPIVADLLATIAKLNDDNERLRSGEGVEALRLESERLRAQVAELAGENRRIKDEVIRRFQALRRSHGAVWGNIKDFEAWLMGGDNGDGVAQLR